MRGLASAVLLDAPRVDELEEGVRLDEELHVLLELHVELRSLRHSEECRGRWRQSCGGLRRGREEHREAQGGLLLRALRGVCSPAIKPHGRQQQRQAGKGGFLWRHRHERSVVQSASCGLMGEEGSDPEQQLQTT